VIILIADFLTVYRDTGKGKGKIPQNTGSDLNKYYVFFHFFRKIKKAV